MKPIRLLSGILTVGGWTLMSRILGFVRDVLQHLPMEFMVETQKLIAISLEGSVG